jgi:hypothetical protein
VTSELHNQRLLHTPLHFAVARTLLWAVCDSGVITLGPAHTYGSAAEVGAAIFGVGGAKLDKGVQTLKLKLRAYPSQVQLNPPHYTIQVDTTTAYSDSEGRDPEGIRLGCAFWVLAVDFEIEGYDEFYGVFGAFDGDDAAPISAGEEVGVCEGCSVDVFVENGDHVLVGIVVKVVYFIASVPFVSAFDGKKYSRLPTVLEGGVLTIADEMIYD